MRLVRSVILCLAILLLAQSPTFATTGSYGDYLTAKAESYFRNGEYGTAARWFIEAEQVSGSDSERASLAYSAGCSRFKQGLTAEAKALFEHVLTHSSAGRSASFARISLRECETLENPLVNFPDGMYLWVQNRWGNDGLSTLDYWLNGWERVRYFILAVPLLFVAARLLRRVL